MMTCASPMELQWIECYSIGTNRTIGTNGRVECIPPQPETIGNILHLNNSYLIDINKYLSYAY